MFDYFLFRDLSLPFIVFDRVVVFLLHCDLFVYFDFAWLNHVEILRLLSFFDYCVSKSKYIDIAVVFNIVNVFRVEDRYFTEKSSVWFWLMGFERNETVEEVISFEWEKNRLCVRSCFEVRFRLRSFGGAFDKVSPSDDLSKINSCVVGDIKYLSLIQNKKSVNCLSHRVNDLVFV
jgi:hypothetical protein